MAEARICLLISRRQSDILTSSQRAQLQALGASGDAVQRLGVLARPALLEACHVYQTPSSQSPRGAIPRTVIVTLSPSICNRLIHSLESSIGHPGAGGSFVGSAVGSPRWIGAHLERASVCGSVVRVAEEDIRVAQTRGRMWYEKVVPTEVAGTARKVGWWRGC